MHLSSWEGCLIDYRVEGRTLGTRALGTEGLCTPQLCLSLGLASIFSLHGLYMQDRLQQSRPLFRCLPASPKEGFALAILGPSLLWGREHSSSCDQVGG